MKESRAALLKIISSILYLTRQGLAIRGHTDNNSNIKQLLKLRSNDSLELDSWLSRTTYKWTSHEIQNEIVSLLSQYVQSNLIHQIKISKYFSIIMDETMDNTCQEQVSVCFRIVDHNLNVSELFLGFFKTESTDALTLFTLVSNILIKFNLSLSDCRGQCYDGAANVSGHITGLQKRILDIEKRAIYVHCVAHTLNLVVQDGMMSVDRSRDFLAMIRSIIVFVRCSPKRQAIFNALQNEQELNSQSLRPFCPTRWCMRVKSLKTLYYNYAVLIKFLDNISKERSENGAKASGFLKQLFKYEFLFYTKIMINIFERVELLNAELQKISLNFHEVKIKIKHIISSIEQQRESGFDDLWLEISTKARELNIKEPNDQRTIKKPKKFIQNSEQYSPPLALSIKDKFKCIYYEIIDVTVSALNGRFQQNVIDHLCSLEKFVIGEDRHINVVIEFYGSDFNRDKLILHRDMFLDIAKSRDVSIKSLQDALNFIKSDNLCDMLSEFSKLLQIMLIIPVSSCTAERSFSALRRLKTFLRSTMTQNRLNDIAILHVHRNEEVDIEKVANTFINKAKVRQNTFAL
uniref:Zinc finger MYM-type protein 1 n=1 Tax=Schizaphis graminum TaxID=13262 RepID=A0A2S2PFM3_SCHGA